jgi:hypothetical protein
MWPPDPLVFVGGSERSGTTLLRNMLTAHPELSIPNESPFTFRTYRDMARRGQEGDVALAWQLLQETSRFKQWRLPVEEVEAMLREHPPGSYADLIRSIFAAYARWRGKPHAGDKTTANALWFPWLAEQFPASRFVHVLRYPRVVCMSRAVQIFNSGGIVGAAEHWRSPVAAAREAMPALGDRILEIRYEQLIAAPESSSSGWASSSGSGSTPRCCSTGGRPTSSRSTARMCTRASRCRRSCGDGEPSSPATTCR